jgi:uncharacterized protein (DUF488 family)
MKSKTSATVYTIGHSRHSIGAFIALLKRHRIERVVDLRGQPYSRHNPQFNREPLVARLEAEGIDYTWSGRRLSGRPRAARLLGPGGEVLWDELAASSEFRSALDSLAATAHSCRAALLCAEEDPLRCHRRFLLTPSLMRYGLEVLHLRGDGRVVPESFYLERGAATECNGQQLLFE